MSLCVCTHMDPAILTRLSKMHKHNHYLHPSSKNELFLGSRIDDKALGDEARIVKQDSVSMCDYKFDLVCSNCDSFG